MAKSLAARARSVLLVWWLGSESLPIGLIG